MTNACTQPFVGESYELTTTSQLLNIDMQKPPKACVNIPIAAPIAEFGVLQGRAAAPLVAPCTIVFAHLGGQVANPESRHTICVTFSAVKRKLQLKCHLLECLLSWLVNSAVQLTHHTEQSRRQTASDQFA